MNVTVFMIFNFSVLSSILRINLIAVMNRHKKKYEKYSWDQNQWPKSMKFTILVACLVEEFIKICLLVIIHLLNYGRFLLEAMEFFRRKNMIQVAGCCRSAKVKFIFLLKNSCETTFWMKNMWNATKSLFFSQIPSYLWNI